jgi:aryl-alcohol dehydrogenase-like predicted oxidoreductase
MTTTTDKPYTVPINTLGKTGLKVSRISLGTMTFGHGDQSLGPIWSWTQKKETVLPIVKRAYEAGINFFDTANFYSQGQSEVILGQCLTELKIPRENVIIATKFSLQFGQGPNSSGLSRKHIFDACEGSLKRLGTSYIDLYIVHTWADTSTPLEETLGALNDLVVSGKVRYLGTSNMYAWQLVRANALAESRGWAKFISVQNLHNLIFREDERELVPAAKCLGVGLTPWSPLAGGFLTGTRKKGAKTDTARAIATEGIFTDLDPKDDDWPIIDRLVELAAKKHVTPSQVALAWLLSKPEISSPIVGATKLSHLEDAIEATKLVLTAEDIKFLEELYLPHGKPPFRV